MQDGCAACLSTNFCCFNVPSSLQAIKSKRAFQKSAARGQRRSEGWPEIFVLQRLVRKNPSGHRGPVSASPFLAGVYYHLQNHSARLESPNSARGNVARITQDAPYGFGLVGGARLCGLLGRCTTAGSIMTGQARTRPICPLTGQP